MSSFSRLSQRCTLKSMRPRAAARWFLIAGLTFQLGIGWHMPVAHAVVPTPEGKSSGMVPEHCLGHAASTPQSASAHSHANAGDASRDLSHHPHHCCGSLGCHCQGVPSLLAPELPRAGAMRFVPPLRPVVARSPPGARPSEPFRPPIA